ncbi:hypothetical protein FVF58_02505 [Paraburkholderia panacisoli]|uniref:Uncharacterized protein n=1 Tax=Paraburkholderia panacisoli TaxID=2603818 RepID=A0A5B0HLX3_9BURK|nr:hypothetical protein [Paraburkholderia panacisoli]KAA1016219.1 hypothetical protein FVF58_02505 [Paraburkholderia panacisoli]
MSTIVYWAHSYREEDAAVNQYFGMLIEQAGSMIVNFDPPSQSVSESKLQQNRRSCDGMVAVLTWRETGPSPYILFEVGLALRARMPVVAFVDDRLVDNILPPRVLQQRFSHRTYFRQVREHSYALRALKAYMGEPPPTRYQPNSGQRGCGVIGMTAMTTQDRNVVTQFVEKRGYRVVNLEKVHTDNPLLFDPLEHLAILHITLRCVDSRTSHSRYWAGAVSAAALPSITLTTNRAYPFNGQFPREFQPRIVDLHGGLSLEEVLKDEFDLFEQNFLSAQQPETIERYVRMQLQAGDLAGNYEAGTRQLFVGAIMGDQYNVSGQTGAVGPQAHAHDISFTQVWNQLEGKIDLVRLADELTRLQQAMSHEAVEADQKLALGAVAAAEQSAREKNGPKTIEYLKTAGKWTLGIAEKIGVDLAKEAIKGAIGL